MRLQNFVRILSALPALIFVFVLSGCGDAVTRDAESFKSDAASVRTLSQIAAGINATKTITPEAFVALKAIREKYPNAPDVVTAYRAALIVRGDWENLEKTITEVPPERRSTEDKELLGKVLVKLGRNKEAIETLRSIRQITTEARGDLALALMNDGDSDQAGKELDSLWQQLETERRADLMALRGSIHLGQNEFKKAEEAFLATLKVDPENKAATYGLTRAYTRLNEPQKAEEFQRKTIEINKISNEREASARKRVEKIYAIEAAWNAKRFDEVIAIANEMLVGSVDPKEKFALYQYLFESHRALGNNNEAEKARSEAIKLQQK